MALKEKHDELWKELDKKVEEKTLTEKEGVEKMAELMRRSKMLIDKLREVGVAENIRDADFIQEETESIVHQARQGQGDSALFGN